MGAESYDPRLGGGFRVGDEFIGSALPTTTWPDTDEYQDWLNDLLESAGDHYDGDEAMEAIATRYVRDLEALASEARALMQRLACLHAYDPECARCDTLMGLRRAVYQVEGWDPDEPIPPSDNGGIDEPSEPSTNGSDSKGEPR